MTRPSRAASLSEPWKTPELGPTMLDEERVRDQISAAEELHYVGHAEPALIAAGAGLGGVLRLRGKPLAGTSASAGAVLEALLANAVISERQHELLYRLLHVYRRLSQGYVPDRAAALSSADTTE